MAPPESLYDSPRLAAGYAYARPPLHEDIVRTIGRTLRIAAPVGRALDIGCGAGLSTAALHALAGTAIGLEPVQAMLAHRRAVAPRARFVIGVAERLPFEDGAFDLLTAAGSLNYADLDQFLPEAARVLAPGGALAIYDFSEGRRFRGREALAEWFAAFERRYPPPPGYDLDVRNLPYASAGLRLEAYEPLDLAAPMTIETYLKYVLSETGVELAISRGAPEAEIRDWCRDTLQNVFGHGVHEVLFDGYVAYVRRSGELPA